MDETEKQFFVITSDFICSKDQFSDLLSDSRVEVFFNVFPSDKNVIVKMIRKIHMNRRINRVINLPGKSLWKCCLDSIKWKKDVLYYVIFLSPVFLLIPIEKLKRIKKNFNVKFICVYLDCLKYMNQNEMIDKYRKQIGLDYELTFDPQDSKTYNMIYCNSVYSMKTDIPRTNIEYDIYLIANNKGRLDKLHAIYKYLKAHEIRMLFRVVGVENEKRSVQGIIYSDKIPYVNVLHEIQKSNCILEVLYDGQTGNTIRYNEAICYNKKLLTNNKNVVNMPFYDPNYIHVFKDPEDIDWKWLKERIHVDYHYDGRFSPVHLIDEIIELEKHRRVI